MKFEFKENGYYFLDDNEKAYRVQNEDIIRLKARPGTRVLRFLNDEDKMISLPLAKAVGEIEGFAAMTKNMKDES